MWVFSLWEAPATHEMTDTGPGRIGILMSGTYKVIELVGSSPVSFTEAVKSAVAEASEGRV
jgi:hypothetical protein